MQIRFSCPTEACPALIELEPLSVAGDAIECPRCHTRHPMALDDAARTGETLVTCPRCGGGEFFVRKDFPQAFGVLLVVVAAVVSTYYLTQIGFYALGILAAAALVDALLYLVIGRVTVCYRCRAEFRKAPIRPEHQPFDLVTAEKYA